MIVDLSPSVEEGLEEEVDLTKGMSIGNDCDWPQKTKKKDSKQANWQKEQQDMRQFESINGMTVPFAEGDDDGTIKAGVKRNDPNNDHSHEEDDSSEDVGFGDDYDSESCSRDSVLSAEARENEIRRGVMIGIIQGKIMDFFSAIFRFIIDTILTLYKWIYDKIIKRCSSSSSEEEAATDLAADLAQDTMDAGDIQAASNQFSSGAFQGGATTTGQTAATTGQMATMAAQSAATATASATTTAAATAAAAASAASSTIASSLAGAVSSVGLATQVGVAVGVATVAVSTGIGVGVSQKSEGPTSSPSYTITDDPFVPPVCTLDADMKQGYVELQIQSFPKEALPQYQVEMERMFRTIYNNISGQCLDPLQRVVHNASLERWEETDVDPQTTITTLYWQATVACGGCPDWEPLFDSSILLSLEMESREVARDNMSNATANTTITTTGSNVTTVMPSNENNTTSPQSLPVTRSLNPRERHLQQVPTLNEFFAIFATTFGFNLGPLLEEASDGAIIIEANNKGMPKVVFATTKAAPGFEGSNGTISIGEEALEQFVDYVQNNNGNVQTPFISDDLSALVDCIDIGDSGNEARGTSTDCDRVHTLLEDKNRNVEPEIVAACIADPTSTTQCQELLMEILDVSSSGDHGAASPLSASVSEITENQDEPTMSPGMLVPIQEAIPVTTSHSPQPASNVIVDGPAPLPPTIALRPTHDLAGGNAPWSIPAVAPTPKGADSTELSSADMATDAPFQSTSIPATPTAPGYSPLPPPASEESMPESLMVLKEPSQTAQPSTNPLVASINTGPTISPTEGPIVSSKEESANSPSSLPVSSSVPSVSAGTFASTRPMHYTTASPTISEHPSADAWLSQETGVGLLKFTNSKAQQMTPWVVGQLDTPAPTGVASLSEETEIELNKFQQRRAMQWQNLELKTKSQLHLYQVQKWCLLRQK
ncbi:hypothetical protein SEMRO_437_G142840.1 [Seminavis robusta]|uniref:Uncharacterized protein n=1 Tax=Seminavis robusta TaxID=568900 RepID=A0A9N8HF28_9STRA|nr:hypothetical protein SEMRO_437_G142840.1 [Seminavis robusta]|eukprot:Sro437_g142840.1 n/a (944) ;mRNA; r:31639-34857